MQIYKTYGKLKSGSICVIASLLTIYLPLIEEEENHLVIIRRPLRDTP